MPGLQGMGLTTEQVIEVVSMYSSSELSIAAVATAPGWYVVGTFPLDVSAKIRLDVVGCVSDASLVLNVRFYCIKDGFVGQVAGSLVTLNSVIDARVISSPCDLVGGRLYQVQAQVVNNAGDDYFGIVRRAAPTGI